MTGSAGRWPVRRLLELGLLAAIVLLAAAVRLPGLDARGQWDSDQGHDMTVLAALVDQGQLPLLGPQTSVGTFHHGAAYYYLLAPAAALSGADPVAVTTEFALIGIGAVAATWWLARLVGGPVAAAVAGLLMAVSPAGISESTFIWNPNPIPLASALALIGVLRARETGRVRWWLLAAIGTMLTMQLHWLGGVLVVPVGAAWALDLRRRRSTGLPTRDALRAGAAALVILAAGYLPLAVHELGNGFSEIRAMLAYAVGGGAASGGSGLAERLVMVAVRAVTWPVAGLVTDRPTLSLVAGVVVVILAATAWLLAGRGRGAADPSGGPAQDEDGTPGASARRAGPDAGRWPVAWLLGAVAWSVAALAVLAPSLGVVTPGLPNDHYHAFLDPIVLALAGAGAARLVSTPWSVARGQGAAGLRGAAGPAAAGVASAVLLGIAVGGWPPAVSPDGGWRLADAAAAHVVAVSDRGWPPDEPRLLVALPAFKPDDAMRFPLTRRGMGLEPPVPATASPGALDVGVVTVVCDPLFDAVTGFPCGGPAEDRWLVDAYPPGTMQLVERFRAGDRRVISIYAPSRLAEMERRRGG